METPGTIFEASLRAALSPWGLNLPQDRLELLRRHYEAMIEANRTMNLTRITEPEDAAVKHYADSLALLTWAAATKRTITTLLDVGTGAGFPAVPLAVLRPEWGVTAIDSTGKKVRFLADVSAALGLVNLTAVHARAEEWSPGAPFCAVSARAVAKAAECVEQAGRHVAPGGALVLYASAPPAGRERSDLARVVARRHLRFLSPFAYELSLRGERLHRSLLVFERSG